MPVTKNLINNGSITLQVARLSNGWLVTAYRDKRNSFQLVVSKNNGTSWSNLCQMYTGDSTDYVLGMSTILADGINVLLIGGYGDINNNDRLWTCHFDATTISSSTNLYSLRNQSVVNSWIGVDAVKYMHGRYQYLINDLSYDEYDFLTRYKAHTSRTDKLPPNSGTTIVSSTNSAVMTGDYDVIGLSDGQEWIFYGSSNTLMLRRRLTANGTLQAAQVLQTLTSNYRIRRLQVVEFSGVVYVFYSWIAEDSSRIGLSYITTTNGTTFSAVRSIYDFVPVHTGQMIDFDVLVGDEITMLAAVPIIGVRVMNIVTVEGTTFKTKAVDIGIADKTNFQKAIYSIAVANKEYSFSVDLDNGTNVIKFKLEVDGIKRFSGSAWESIEQGYRYGTSWQENNGKRFNGSTWQDIT